MTRVFQTNAMGEAHVRIALVSKGEADLLVHRVDSWGLALGAGRWFFTRDKQEASVWVFVGTPEMAQLRVCFVELIGESGWVKPGHRLANVFK